MKVQAKYILLDIEGTLSDIHFVKNILFPFSAKQMNTYVTENTQELQPILNEVPGQKIEDKIQQLQTWIQEDVKINPLKQLQGLIWKKGFESGEFKSPLYEDVLPSLQAWRQKGLSLGIYSSGSVSAQKLFFKHTEQGDLLSLFQNHFDLEVGSKKEAESYQKICSLIKLEPADVLFLSDIEAELLAAQKAGLKALQVVRSGTEASKVIEYVHSFSDLEVTAGS